MSEMAYDYIRSQYGCRIYPGDTVEHIEAGHRGTVRAPDPRALHYVQVEFKHGRRSCHPLALEIFARGHDWEVAQAMEPSDEQ